MPTTPPNVRKKYLEAISTQLGILRNMLSTKIINTTDIEHMIHVLHIIHSKWIIAGEEPDLTLSSAINFLNSSLTTHELDANANSLLQLRAAEKLLSTIGRHHDAARA